MRALSELLALSFVLSGCTTLTTEIRVRDATEVALIGGHPQSEADNGVEVVRAANGDVSLRCTPSARVPDGPIVSASGAIQLHSPWASDWHKGQELSVPLTLSGAHKKACPDVASRLVTPWSNVSRIVERRTPERFEAAVLLAVGLPLVGIGALVASQPGAGQREVCSTRGCSSVRAFGVTMGVVGALFALPGLLTLPIPSTEQTIVPSGAP
jgi:hypothetical protein